MKVYRDLPNDYKSVFRIDAKESKTGTIFNVIAILVMAVVGVSLALPLIINGESFTKIEIPKICVILLVALGVLLYVVLHELLHGLVYKLLTKEKLTFGLSWSCVFCGVNGYVVRSVALLAVLAPLVVFSLVFIPLTIVLIVHKSVYYIFVSSLLAFHLGGCVGDMYLSFLLLFKYKDKSTLVRDTGPEQNIYQIVN